MLRSIIIWSDDGLNAVLPLIKALNLRHVNLKVQIIRICIQHQMLISDPMAVANAAANALDAAFGGGGIAGVSMALPPVPALTTTSAPTRVLVLLNMVMDVDLATDDDHKMLEEEVREEVSRYGKLISLKIPRPQVSILFSLSVI